MSYPIQPTPTLYGEDAEKFMNKFYKHHHINIEINYKQVLENIKKIRKNIDKEKKI